MVWNSHLFQNFPVDCDPHSQGFGIVNKAEIDVFLEISCFFHDPADVGNLISGNLELALMGGVILSKNLLHLSADGWGCVPSL